MKRLTSLFALSLTLLTACETIETNYRYHGRPVYPARIERHIERPVERPYERDRRDYRWRDDNRRDDKKDKYDFRKHEGIKPDYKQEEKHEGNKDKDKDKKHEEKDNKQKKKPSHDSFYLDIDPQSFDLCYSNF